MIDRLRAWSEKLATVHTFGKALANLGEVEQEIASTIAELEVDGELGAWPKWHSFYYVDDVTDERVHVRISCADRSMLEGVLMAHDVAIAVRYFFRELRIWKAEERADRAEREIDRLLSESMRLKAELETTRKQSADLWQALQAEREASDEREETCSVQWARDVMTWKVARAALRRELAEERRKAARYLLELSKLQMGADLGSEDPTDDAEEGGEVDA